MSLLIDYYCGSAGKRFLRRSTLALGLGALLLVALFELTDLDRTLARYFFDAQSNSFPLKHAWIFKQVLHRGARNLSVLCALVVVALTLAAWFGRKRAPHTSLAALACWRVELTFLSIALIAPPLVVGTLKEHSKHACPWDVAEFGGSQAYRPLLSLPPGRFDVEGCLPAAHPLTGFAWLALALAIRPHNTRCA